MKEGLEVAGKEAAKGAATGVVKEAEKGLVKEGSEAAAKEGSMAAGEAATEGAKKMTREERWQELSRKWGFIKARNGAHSAAWRDGDAGKIREGTCTPSQAIKCSGTWI